MSTAHTPGPWVWDDRSLHPAVRNPDTCNVHSILDAEGGYGFIGGDNKACIAELEADYRLIAAAPDLLDAAIVACQMLDTLKAMMIDRYDTHIHLKAIRAVLQAAADKATGVPA